MADARAPLLAHDALPAMQLDLAPAPAPPEDAAGSGASHSDGVPPLPSTSTVASNATVGFSDASSGADLLSPRTLVSPSSSSAYGDAAGAERRRGHAGAGDGSKRKRKYKQRKRRMRRFGSGQMSTDAPLLQISQEMDTDYSEAGSTSGTSAHGFAVAVTRSAPVLSPRGYQSAPLPRVPSGTRGTGAPNGAPKSGTLAGSSKKQRSRSSKPSERRRDGYQAVGSAPVPEVRSPYHPTARDGMYHKVKYYGNLHRLAGKESARLLRQSGGVEQSPIPVWRPQLLPPAHVLPAYLFGLEDVTSEPQSSWATISSIVNTMLGTTIVALPYAMLTTGVVLGITIMGFIGLVACFTCLLVVKHGREFDTFQEFVTHHLGRGMGFVSWLMSVGIILGAAMVYHILMKMAINRIVECIGRAAGSTLSDWSSTYAALVVLVLFPLTTKKDLKVLVKFNSFGFVFVWYCVLFIVFKGAQAWWNGLVRTADHAGPAPIPGHHPDTTVDLLASISFGAMSGMATLAFFIHNIIHTITKNSDPKVVKRDVILGYSLAGGVYAVVAAMGALGLAESLPSVTHLDNILVVYSDTDWYAVSAQMAQVCQLMTVYPLLVLIVRTQVFELLYHDAFPGRIQVTLLSAATMGVTLLFALYFPDVSVVMRYTGAICGLVIIFCVPVMIDILVRRKRNKMSWKWWLIHGTIMSAGLFSVVAQFVPIFSQP